MLFTARVATHVLRDRLIEWRRDVALAFHAQLRRSFDEPDATFEPLLLQGYGLARVAPPLWDAFFTADCGKTFDALASVGPLARSAFTQSIQYTRVEQRHLGDESCECGRQSRWCVEPCLHDGPAADYEEHQNGVHLKRRLAAPSGRLLRLWLERGEEGVEGADKREERDVDVVTGQERRHPVVQPILRRGEAAFLPICRALRLSVGSCTVRDQFGLLAPAAAPYGS